MDGRRTMTAAEPMAEHRDGMRRTAEAEARAMRREAMAYLALFAIGQICAAVVAVVLPRLLGVHRRVCTDGCAPTGVHPEKGCVPKMGDPDILGRVSVKISRKRGSECMIAHFVGGGAMLCRG